ncbi:MAG: 3-dehydroquinate synthase family protein [Candidatus Rhabdochlamydia sp.]
MNYVIICDAHVAAIYEQEIREGMKRHFSSSALLLVEPGEEAKSLKTFEALALQLIELGCDKQVTLIALGGGTILDLTGFLASTYCRGVKWIAMPTTLLAMVDASIGGKTALNLGGIKNWMGSHYFPSKRIICPTFLKTLPDCEWENGIVEMIKIFLLTDEALFRQFSTTSFGALILEATEAKRRLISRDPYEKGARVLLNLGHTLGHALEGLSSYQISHGTAVGMGIVLEARLSYRMNILPLEDLRLIEETFPLSPISFSSQTICAQLQFDKKNKHNLPHFVLLKRLGQAYIEGDNYCHVVPEKILIQVLDDACLRSC